MHDFELGRFIQLAQLPITPFPRGSLCRVIQKVTARELRATLDQGIDQLRHNNYIAARELFTRLRLIASDGARAWYFSAIAEGHTSGVWDGEAKRLAEIDLACDARAIPSRLLSMLR